MRPFARRLARQVVFAPELGKWNYLVRDAKTDGHADWIIRLASSRPIMYSSEASSRNNIAVRLDDEAAVYNYFLSRMYSEGVSLKRSRKSVLK